MPKWNWIVEAESAHERIDKALVGALEREEGTWEPTDSRVPVTRTRIQALIEEGAVSVDGVTAHSKSKLEGGSEVIVSFPAPRPLALIPEDIPLDILFEDEHLAVINKPAGLTVHPSETQTEGTLVHALLHRLKSLSGIGGWLRPGIVHRLDKNTSGALVVSKSDETHVALAEIFSRHDLERRYWALCYEVPDPKKAKASELTLTAIGDHTLRVESRIGRSPTDRKKMSVSVKEGRQAITEVSLEAKYGSGPRPFASWIEAKLHTGRTHQVRVHLTALGASLLGDPVYGTASPQAKKFTDLPTEIKAAVEGLSGQALHARVLAFRHPITGQSLRFEAEPPPAFRALMDALEKYER